MNLIQNEKELFGIIFQCLFLCITVTFYLKNSEKMNYDIL